MKKKVLSLLLLSLVLFTSCGDIDVYEEGIYKVKSYSSQLSDVDFNELKLKIKFHNDGDEFFFKSFEITYEKGIKTYKIKDLSEISDPNNSGYLVEPHYGVSNKNSEGNTIGNYGCFKFINTKISTFPPLLANGDISCYYYEPYIPYLEEYKPSEGYIARCSPYFNKKVNKVLTVKFTISLVKYNYDENSKYIDYSETETSDIIFEKESSL